MPDLWAALDVDAGEVLSNTAGRLFDSMVPTRATVLPFTPTQGLVTFALPETAQRAPFSDTLYVIARGTLVRAQHGPNVINAGAGIRYGDPFGVAWTEQTPGVVVEAHGAAVWVEYACEGGAELSSLPGTAQVVAYDGACYIPVAPSEVVMDVTAYNAGDAVARNITVTLELPDGVTVTTSTPPWAYIEGRRVTWTLGDLAPGMWRSLAVVFRVQPTAGVWGDVSATVFGQVLGIHHSDGAFYDDYSRRIVEGQLGDAFWFNVFRAPQKVYLPVVMRGYDVRPDLVIEQVTVDPGDPAAVQVIIANVGQRPASDFWVDLYLDPAQPPTGNQPWPELCEFYGAAWQVESLDAGERLVLTIGGAYYSESYSQWPEVAYPTGDHTVWAYVDSLGADVHGWVNETDESNNRYGPVTFVVPDAPADVAVLKPANAFLPRLKEP